MYPIQNGGVESPIASDRNQPATPVFDRRLNVDFSQGSAKKRPRSYTSPPARDFTEANQSITQKNQMTSSNEAGTKIVFPPFVFKFIGEQKATIKEITDELILGWKQQHGIDLCITARFGHMQSVLIFTDEAASFESLLSTSRWPRSLSGVEVNVKEQRQLPPEYSLVIQQFHRNWDERDWIDEMQARYPSLSKMTRMRIKDGSPLNAVRADFTSVEEVRQIIKLGKICVGSMIHPVKRYYLPVRINKCQKCLQHDHTTKSCSSPRLCPRCATEHTMEFACSNDVRCANCGGGHFSGNSACPIVQEKRRTLLENSKKQRAELLVLAERQQCEDNSTKTREGIRQPLDTIHHQSIQPQRRSYAQSVQAPPARAQQQNIELILSSFLEKMEQRLDQFSSRLSSQICEIEKRTDTCEDRQGELEKTLAELVLPAIRELAEQIANSAKNGIFQETSTKIINKLTAAIDQHTKQPARREHQCSSNRNGHHTTHDQRY